MARIGQSKVGHLEGQVAEQNGPGIPNTAVSGWWWTWVPMGGSGSWGSDEADKNGPDLL